MYKIVQEVELATQKKIHTAKLEAPQRGKENIFRQKLNLINNTYAPQLNHMVWNPITNNTKTCKPYTPFNDRGITTIAICESEFNANVIRFPLANVPRYYLFDWRHNRTSRIWIYMNIFSHKSIAVTNSRAPKLSLYRAIVSNEDSKIGFKYCRILIMLSLKLNNR